MLRRVFTVATLAVLLCGGVHCSENLEEWPCPPGAGGFDTRHEARIPLVASTGEIIDGNARTILSLSFDPNPENDFADFALVHWPTLESSRYSTLLRSGGVRDLLASHAGDRFALSGTAYVAIEGRSPCHAEPTLAVNVEVTAARGNIDMNARTIDRDYLRSFTFDVDWKDLGCGLGAIRGRVVHDLTLDAFTTNCSDAFRLVGDAAPPPDGSVMDGGEDAAGDAQSTDADLDARADAPD
jgi:hypothetical protein